MKVRQPKQLLPRLFAFLLFRSYFKSSPAIQLRKGDRANKGNNNLCCLTQPIYTHEPIRSKRGEFLISQNEKRKLKRVYQNAASESIAFVSKWKKWTTTCSSCRNNMRWFHLGFPPLLGFVQLFSVTDMAKEKLKKIVSKRKPGNGGKQEIDKLNSRRQLHYK